MRTVDPSKDRHSHGIDSERSADEVIPESEDRRGLPCTDNTALVEAELALCSLLSDWNPWDLPEKATLDQLQRVAAAMSGREQHPHQHCLVRQSVIKEIQFEREHFNTSPDRFKYQAAARWRLKTGTSGNCIMAVIGMRLQTSSSIVSPSYQSTKLLISSNSDVPVATVTTIVWSHSEAILTSSETGEYCGGRCLRTAAGNS